MIHQREKIKSSVYENMIPINKGKLRVYKEKSKEKPKEGDSDFHFCMSLLPYMRNIPLRSTIMFPVYLDKKY